MKSIGYGIIVVIFKMSIMKTIQKCLIVILTLIFISVAFQNYAYCQQSKNKQRPPICNNNGACESHFGETEENCDDCRPVLCINPYETCANIGASYGGERPCGGNNDMLVDGCCCVARPICNYNNECEPNNGETTQCPDCQ